MPSLFFLAFRYMEQRVLSSHFFTLCRCACASVVNMRCLFLGIRSLTGHGVHQVSYRGKVPCFNTWIGDIKLRPLCLSSCPADPASCQLDQLSHFPSFSRIFTFMIILLCSYHSYKVAKNGSCSWEEG